jgi:predicted RNA-binding protein YlxR (DUF448 family)
VTMAKPLRSCVACRRVRAKAELVRVARPAGDDPRLDLAGTSPGRGAYVCREPACVDQAIRRGGLTRALRAALPPDQATRLRAMVSA